MRELMFVALCLIGLGSAEARADQASVCASEDEVFTLEQSTLAAIKAEQNPMKRQMLVQELVTMRNNAQRKRQSHPQGSTFSDFVGKLTKFDAEQGVNLEITVNCPIAKIVFVTWARDVPAFGNQQDQSDLKILRPSLTQVNRGDMVIVSGRIGYPQVRDRAIGDILLTDGIFFGAQITSIQKQ